jgi:hypothetical protein
VTIGPDALATSVPEPALLSAAQVCPIDGTGAPGSRDAAAALDSAVSPSELLDTAAAAAHVVTRTIDDVANSITDAGAAATRAALVGSAKGLMEAINATRREWDELQLLVETATGMVSLADTANDTIGHHPIDFWLGFYTGLGTTLWAQLQVAWAITKQLALVSLKVYQCVESDVIDFGSIDPATTFANPQCDKAAKLAFGVGSAALTAPDQLLALTWALAPDALHLMMTVLRGVYDDLYVKGLLMELSMPDVVRDGNRLGNMIGSAAAALVTFWITDLAFEAVPVVLDFLGESTSFAVTTPTTANVEIFGGWLQRVDQANPVPPDAVLSLAADTTAGTAPPSDIAATAEASSPQPTLLPEPPAGTGIQTAALATTTPAAPGLLAAGVPAKLARDRAFVVNAVTRSIRGSKGATATLAGITPDLLATISKQLLQNFDTAQLAGLLPALEELAAGQLAGVQWTIAAHRDVQAAIAPVNKAVSAAVLLEILNSGADYTDEAVLVGEIRAGWLRVLESAHIIDQRVLPYLPDAAKSALGWQVADDMDAIATPKADHTGSLDSILNKIFKAGIPELSTSDFDNITRRVMRSIVTQAEIDSGKQLPPGALLVTTGTDPVVVFRTFQQVYRGLAEDDPHYGTFATKACDRIDALIAKLQSPPPAP